MPDDNSDKNITNKPHTRFGPNALQGINTKLLPCKSTCKL